MPLKKGSSSRTVNSNISELMNKPSKKRKKAIDTIANKYNISKKQAQQKQAVAIAISTAKK